MLLREEPLQRELYAPRAPPARGRQTPIEEVQREQPPERRVDATEVPEIRFAAGLRAAAASASAPGMASGDRRDEFGDLPVRGLMLSERLESYGGRPCELGIPAKGHADGADGRIPSEDGRISPAAGTPAGGGGEDARGCHIAAQEVDRSGTAGLDQSLPAGGARKLEHGAA